MMALDTENLKRESIRNITLRLSLSHPSFHVLFCSRIQLWHVLHDANI